MRRFPQLVLVHRRGVLPSGRAYVLSFVEIWPEQIVVRFVGLDDGASRELRDLGMSLVDETGQLYAWRATSSGGMVLPEEVCAGLVGPLSDEAEWVILGAPGGAINERINVSAATEPLRSN